MRRQAVWFGRFQPPSIAHAASLHALLETWVRVEIGIVKATTRPQNNDPATARWIGDDTSFSKERNPFLPEEVKRMWDAYIQETKLSTRVRTRIVPRPEYWADYRTEFPPRKYNHVQIEGGSGDAMTESLRQNFSPRHYRRKIWRVKPPFLLHNSKIREKISKGEGAWSDFIPQGAYEIFLEIRGPERIGSI